MLPYGIAGHLTAPIIPRNSSVGVCLNSAVWRAGKLAPGKADDGAKRQHSQTGTVWSRPLPSYAKWSIPPAGHLPGGVALFIYRDGRLPIPNEGHPGAGRFRGVRMIAGMGRAGKSRQGRLSTPGCASSPKFSAYPHIHRMTGVGIPTPRPQRERLNNIRIPAPIHWHRPMPKADSAVCWQAGWEGWGFSGLSACARQKRTAGSRASYVSCHRWMST